MAGKVSLDVKTLFITAALIFGLMIAWSALNQNSSKAFGGNFAPQMSPPGERYQIAGCDGNSAWVIDTTSGDVFLIYSNGRWKDVGSIMDEKKRMKK